MELQTRLWSEQHWFEETKRVVLLATDVYEKLGAAQDLERCQWLLLRVGNSGREFLKTVLLGALIDSILFSCCLLKTLPAVSPVYSDVRFRTTDPAVG